jgi:hypothetical protein
MEDIWDVKCKEFEWGGLSDVSGSDRRAIAQHKLENTHFPVEMGMRTTNWAQTVVAAVKRVQFVSDRMSYIIMRGRWFPKYHKNILLGAINGKVGRKDIFILTIGNESLHEISNDKMELK